ncbi:MAG: GNAT family N-acetyltransferase [Leptolyngbyaceae cyanobacterium SL_7_1]|nr:GNAT family N-acetyltransferase [Leptolyngbyaceae cyanobacterium SL_7_1]
MIKIQPYTPFYTQPIIDLILTIQQQEFGLPITLNAQPDLLKIAEFYQAKKGNFWIAVESDRVIGTIALIDIDNHQGVLRKMFVHPHYRGKALGVGQTLLETLLNWAIEHSIYEIYLGTVEVFKAAHRFYEKNGFVQIPPEELPSTFALMPGDTRFYRHRGEILENC